MKIGDQLRAARLAARLTQEQLAFQAGLDRSYISQLERDLKSPTLETLSRLCRELNIRISKLIMQAEDAASPSD